MSDEVRFTDCRGLTWTVYEIPARKIVFDDRVVDDSGSYLIFETRSPSRCVQKRLRRYPSEWREADASTLEELCERAGPTSSSVGIGTERARRSIEELST